MLSREASISFEKWCRRDEMYVGYLKRELDTVKAEQEKLAQDPAQKREANKMAKVMTSLLDEVVRLESKYKIGIDASAPAQPQTELGQQLQSVKTDAGTVRVKAPDGTIAEIPQASLQKYLDKGATIVR